MQESSEEEEKRMQYYDRKAVGARIKQMRIENGITQSKLAEYLDYTTERQLQRIESGETGCAIDKLVEIAQILNTSTDYLLFGMKEDNAGDILGKLVQGKTENQKIFMMRVIKTIADNIELVVSTKNG